MLGNTSFLLISIGLPLVAIAVGAYLAYWLIRAAVAAGLRDHHKWLERRTEKTLPPEPGPDRNLPYDHNV
ncbi:hypothetical protein [Rhodoglobus aureus]|uniref:Uncharacterized protein n=1 Tax=Rhodoglobus aureus TaxID=191497 RepID=A0ABP4GAX2_9MICO